MRDIRKKKRGKVWVVGLIALGVGIYMLAGESSDQKKAEKNAEKPAAAAANPAAAGQALPVTVQTVNQQSVSIWSEFSGRLQAVDFAEIRPEVSGKIVAIKFDDGQTVKAGDVLFIIDPQVYQANVARSEANLASAKTNAQLARTEMQRASGLLKAQVVAQSRYDEKANASRMADSTIKVAEAELRQSRIDLGRAYVKAPISGRVSRAELTVGNLVQAGPNAPVLTSVISNEGIYADFEVDEQTYMQNIRSGAKGKDDERKIPVELTVHGDKSYIYKGNIQSFDNRIDGTSGTIRARAKFANEDGALVPGMFVSVRVGSSNTSNVLLVPEKAIGSDQNKKFVFVVGDDNKVIYKEVAVGKAVNDSRIIVAGIQPGERVIVDGIMQVKPNMLVEPTESTITENSVQNPHS